MGNLFSLHFWFNLRPPALLPIYQKFFIGLVIALIVASFIFWFIKSKRRNVYINFWRNLYYFSFTNSFIGIVLLFFSYELVPFLSARFWFLLWGAGIIAWLIFIFKSLIAIPKRRKKIAEEEEYKKYIP